MIKQCKSNEEIEKIAKEVIEIVTKEAYEENVESSYIGTELDINPLNYHLDDISFKLDKYYSCVNVWNGYVPKGMKIVYGRFFNDKFKTSTHKGCYYYLDDDSYVFDFFKYIKNIQVDDEYDIIVAVYRFIEKMFTCNINAKDRDDINKLIYKDNDLYFRPIKEHSIKDFYGNGSAMCSERSIVAENLLSAMGLEVISMQDKGHAYNIYAHHSNDDTEIYIVDFSDWVGCYDVNFNLVSTLPFFKKIEGATADDIDKIANEGKRIELNDYYLYDINGSVYEIVTKNKRNYGVDFALQDEKSLILKRR